jgi:hypothetical protein
MLSLASCTHGNVPTRTKYSEKKIELSNSYPVIDPLHLVLVSIQ